MFGKQAISLKGQLDSSLARRGEIQGETWSRGRAVLKPLPVHGEGGGHRVVNGGSVIWRRSGRQERLQEAGMAGPISQADMEAIFSVTDGMGIHREAVVVPLGRKD